MSLRASPWRWYVREQDRAMSSASTGGSAQSCSGHVENPVRSGRRTGAASSTSLPQLVNLVSVSTGVFVMPLTAKTQSGRLRAR